MTVLTKQYREKLMKENKLLQQRVDLIQIQLNKDIFDDDFKEKLNEIDTQLNKLNSDRYPLGQGMISWLK